MRAEGVDRIEGRIQGKAYELEVTRSGDEATFNDGTIELKLRLSTRELLGWKALDPALTTHDPARVPHRHAPDHIVPMVNLYRMEALLRGVLNTNRVNYINAPHLAASPT